MLDEHLFDVKLAPLETQNEQRMLLRAPPFGRAAGVEDPDAGVPLELRDVGVA
jgi:hypothetical protein